MIKEKIALWEDIDDVFLHTMLREFEPNPMLPTAPEAMPAVIVCPGGAYLFCSVALEGDTTALAFLNGGYQTFILEYTVGSKNSACRHPMPLLDLAKAMLIIRENAEKWHVDPERIALAGFSAGGNLVANMATMWHKPMLREYFGVESECFRPMAVILGYALTDYVYQEEYNLSLLPSTLMLDARLAVFGTKDPTVEQLEEMSPCLHVTEKTPPMFLVHAANDSLVPARHSLKMASALAEAGVEYELHIFKNGEHGFATGVPNGAPYRSDRYFAISAWIDLALKWLMHHAAPETAEHNPSVAEGMRQRARGNK